MAYPFDPYNMPPMLPGMGFNFQSQPLPPEFEQGAEKLINYDRFGPPPPQATPQIAQAPPAPPVGPQPMGQPTGQPMGQKPFQPSLQGIDDTAPPFQVPGSNVANLAAGIDPQMQQFKKVFDTLYQPDERVGNEMWQMLQNMPQRPKRGTGRKILAATAGAFLGPGVAQEMMYGGYNADMADWQTKFDPLAKLAADERARNTNERMLAGNIASSTLRNQNDLLTNALGRDTLAVRREELEFKKQIEQWDRENPELELQIDADGNVFGVGPGGTVKPLGIKALSPTMKMEIEQRNRVALVRARAEEQRRTESVRPGSYVPFVTVDADGKTTTVVVNSKTGLPRAMTLDGQTVSNIMRPGTNKNMVGQPKDLEFIRGMARESLTLIDDVIDDKGKLTAPAAAIVGGSRLNPLNWIWGSPEYTANASINAIKSKQVLDLIQRMKTASETGATGFGALNLQELRVLENSATMLNDPAISDEVFEREMNKIRDRLQLIMADPTETPSGQQGAGFSMTNQPAMRKQVKNAQGEVRDAISRDGGKTWTVE